MSEPGSVAVTAALAWVEHEGVEQLLERPLIVFERPGGRILDIRLDASEPPEGLLVFDLGNSLLLPGMVNAHSHAFQRMIRGLPQGRPGAVKAAGASGETPASFWSWRGAMYEAANRLGPEQVYAQTRACFSEMVDRGITCVGEFHYLHHQADGQPYADPNELSLQVVRAARDVGLRLCLLEVFYARAGFEQPGPLPEQRRFCDASLDAYFARVEAMRAHANTLAEESPGAAPMSVGLAPHSVRAVPEPALRELAAYANEHGLALHAHVSEQPRENAECQAEHGKTPLEVFAEAGAMARAGAFTAVHAIHVAEHELALMRGQQICACPTTEADLGDGVGRGAHSRGEGGFARGHAPRGGADDHPRDRRAGPTDRDLGRRPGRGRSRGGDRGPRAPGTDRAGALVDLDRSPDRRRTSGNAGGGECFDACLRRGVAAGIGVRRRGLDGAAFASAGRCVRRADDPGARRPSARPRRRGARASGGIYSAGAGDGRDRAAGPFRSGARLDALGRADRPAL